MTNERDDPAGTANKLRQAKLYNELSEEYFPEGANLLTSRNLTRNGVPMTPEGVSHWATINQAAERGLLDLEQERAIANAKTDALTGAMLGRAVGDPSSGASGTLHAEIDDERDFDEEEEDEEEEDEEEEDLSEGEGPDFGFDNEEDNDEARADYIRKIQENSDD